MPYSVRAVATWQCPFFARVPIDTWQHGSIIMSASMASPGRNVRLNWCIDAQEKGSPGGGRGVCPDMREGDSLTFIDPS